MHLFYFKLLVDVSFFLNDKMSNINDFSASFFSTIVNPAKNLTVYSCVIYQYEEHMLSVISCILQSKKFAVSYHGRHQKSIQHLSL